MTEPTEQFIEVGGARIRVLRGGSGTPLVWLHSVEGDLGWRRVHRELAGQATVYVPTLPGYAGSDRPDWLETVADVARYLLWLLDALGLEKVSLAGHGLGGWIAAELAVMCPHVLDRLILIDAAGVRPERGEIADIFLLGLEETRKQAWHDPGQSAEYAELYDRELSAEERDAQIQNQEMSVRLAWKPYMFDPSLPHLLPRSRVPTLVVWGREDRIVPLECGEIYQRAIPKARLDVIDRCGHLPHLERPDEVARLIAEFLRS